MFWDVAGAVAAGIPGSALSTWLVWRAARDLIRVHRRQHIRELLRQAHARLYHRRIALQRLPSWKRYGDPELTRLIAARVLIRARLAESEEE